MLVADESKHPIRRHYTPSDRVHCDGSGVVRMAGPSWTLACAVPARQPVRKLVTDEVLHPIGKIQPVLIGLKLP